MKAIDIIGRCKHAFGLTTQTALAKKIDLTPSSITDALRRGEIPEVWLYKVAYRTGRRVEWLRSGEGLEFADVAAEGKEKYRRTLPPALQGLVDQWADLSETERSIVESAMKLLLDADAETRDLVVKVVKSVRAHRKFQRQQRRSSPPKKSAGSV